MKPSVKILLSIFAALSLFIGLFFAAGNNGMLPQSMGADYCEVETSIRDKIDVFHAPGYGTRCLRKYDLCCG